MSGHKAREPSGGMPKWPVLVLFATGSFWPLSDGRESTHNGQQKAPPKRG